ncbi:MAG: glutathione S-transferase family protein [Alphaproteobacteria bacterium]|nr:glutathione S-transferase family protein [Alphaproteobacteria bacterium]
MSFVLYHHPLSSYCWKVSIALYEADADFEARLVNLGDPAERAEYLTLSPFGKIPVLRDETAKRTLLETSLIIEYLAMTVPGAAGLLPAARELAFPIRAKDRFFDLYVNTPIGKIVTDRLRPQGGKDAIGVEAARNDLQTAIDIVEREMADSSAWAAGDTFTMADCAAAPALYYANKIEPFGDTHPNATAYLGRLTGRPSVARVIREAEPFFSMMPA